MPPPSCLPFGLWLVTVYAAPTAAARSTGDLGFLELADTGSPSKYIFAQLVIRLGQPHEISAGPWWVATPTGRPALPGPSPRSRGCRA
jgi:hypothetical protein